MALVAKSWSNDRPEPVPAPARSMADTREGLGGSLTRSAPSTIVRQVFDYLN